MAVGIGAAVGVPPLVRAWWSRWRFCARAGAGARGGGAGAARGAGGAGGDLDQSDPAGPWRGGLVVEALVAGPVEVLRQRLDGGAGGGPVALVEPVAVVEALVEPMAGRWWRRYRRGGAGGDRGARGGGGGARAGGSWRWRRSPGAVRSAGQGAHEGAVVVLVAAITGRTSWRRTGWWWR